jgi:hypothetical protein
MGKAPSSRLALRERGAAAGIALGRECPPLGGGAHPAGLPVDRGTAKLS